MIVNTLHKRAKKDDDDDVNNNNNNNNNSGSKVMGKVAHFNGVDTALVLMNPYVQ